MSDDNDFFSQMQLLVLEGSSLFEFPMGSTDLLPSGNVHHGPWSPTDCACVLDAWYSEDWLTLVVDQGHADALGAPEWWQRTVADAEDPRFRQLSPGDATRLLRFPAKWLPGTPDGNVMVCQTKTGEATKAEMWDQVAEAALSTVARKTPRFFRRPWSEVRGDSHSDWGTCVYYFWTLDGVVEQQIERYARGMTLAYDRYHPEDEFGFMTTEPLVPAEDWEPFAISMETYQAETNVRPSNRR
ncbi:hypothetical protein ASE01_23690 [Nocardioides sp. Root190]|uniref:hypothetical protein n=1 Tax=Nocardioides sp. Root190 TaxID=1736488 RepID=UPI0006F811AE|nr:hypothetical protein [Nocardioides sp. Root190]KRB78843.1 hypothetical protein ASE01_23690 [Nocardioides sp. Root190]